MSRWKCVYKGKPVSLFNGHLGPSAPSWHTFDARIWERGDARVTLHNLTNLARNAGDPREYWLIRDKSGQHRRVTRYGVVVTKPNMLMCKLQGGNWTELVQQAKDIADGAVTFEQWRENWLDDELLAIIEESNVWGIHLSNIEWELSCNLMKPDRKLIRKRLRWLTVHGFIFPAGGTGAGTRWRIA